MFADQISNDLAKIKSKHLYRKLKVIDSVKKNKILIDGQWLVNFASNDYLGLSQNKKIQQAIIQGIREFGAGAGCLLYTSPSPRDLSTSRMPSSA